MSIDKMTKSMKALCLSAFVLPGAGHFFLKKYIGALFYSGVTLVALYFLMAGMVKKTFEVSRQLQAGEVPFDISILSELIFQKPVGEELQIFNLSMLALILTWGVSMLDAYRLGKAQE